MITATLPSENKTISDTIMNKRLLVLKAESITEIPTPRDPDNYQ